MIIKVFILSGQWYDPDSIPEDAWELSRCFDLSNESDRAEFSVLCRMFYSAEEVICIFNELLNTGYWYDYSFQYKYVV